MALFHFAPMVIKLVVVLPASQSSMKVIVMVLGVAACILVVLQCIHKSVDTMLNRMTQQAGTSVNGKGTSAYADRCRAKQDLICKDELSALILY